jgi:hypothetical protein
MVFAIYLGNVQPLTKNIKYANIGINKQFFKLKKKFLKMKKICSFPKILLFIVGVINFNFASANSLPIFKKKYTEKADMAYGSIVSDIKAKNDIYYCTQVQWLEKICANYALQGGTTLSVNQMLALIMDPTQTTIEKISHTEIVNSHWTSKVIEDWVTEEDTYYVCHNGIVLFKINCGNPARRKQNQKKTGFVDPAPLPTPNPAATMLPAPNQQLPAPQQYQQPVAYQQSQQMISIDFPQWQSMNLPGSTGVNQINPMNANIFYNGGGTIAQPGGCPSGQYLYTYADGSTQCLSSTTQGNVILAGGVTSGNVILAGNGGSNQNTTQGSVILAE